MQQLTEKQLIQAVKTAIALALKDLGGAYDDEYFSIGIIKALKVVNKYDPSRTKYTHYHWVVYCCCKVIKSYIRRERFKRKREISYTDYLPDGTLIPDVIEPDKTPIIPESNKDRAIVELLSSGGDLPYTKLRLSRKAEAIYQAKIDYLRRRYA